MITFIPTVCKKCPLYQEKDLFCANLSRWELHSLAKGSGPARLRCGEKLDMEKLHGFPIIGVGSGAVSVQFLLKGGGKSIAKIFSRGDIIDLREAPNPGTGLITALSRVTFCILSPTIFDEIVATNYWVKKYLSNRPRVSATMAATPAAAATENTALKTIASFLLQCHKRQITVFSGDNVRLPVPRCLLAEFLGIESSLVASSFRDLERQQILAVSDGLSTHLRIKKLPALQQLEIGDDIVNAA